MTAPNFKDQLTADLGTFINPDEFGEIHRIQGRELLCIVESLNQTKHPLSYAEGVSLFQTRVHVTKEILGFIPSEGSQLELDDEWYSVATASEDAGIVIITLEGNQA